METNFAKNVLESGVAQKEAILSVQVEVMSLAHTTNDSLARILHYLEGKDVLRLSMTGSKWLMSRLWQNLAELFLNIHRPTFFPSWIFTFANLRTLKIEMSGFQRDAHLCMQGRSILPPKPMKSLGKLVLRFSQSHLIFEPQLSQRGLSLSSSFPNLTSLKVHSASTSLPPHGWVESLPKKLTALSLSLDIECRDENNRIHPSSFDLLPKGLQKLFLNAPIAAGPLNLRRFRNLRYVYLSPLLSLDVLDSLPSTLEHASFGTSYYCDYRIGQTVFAHSKFPPKIRSWCVWPFGLKYEADCMAPATLEKFGLLSFLQPESLRGFHSENFLELTCSYCDMTPELSKLLPNVERLFGALPGSTTAMSTFPRTLKLIPLNWRRDTDSESFKDLPPSLTSYYDYVSSVDNILDLPKSLKSLNIYAFPSPMRLTSKIWAQLPPKLVDLGITLSMLNNVANCLAVLPRTLESLTLDLKGLPSNSDMVEQIVFPKWMQQTLKTLTIKTPSWREQESAPVKGSCNSLIPKLSTFSCLSTLQLRAAIVLKSDTLANLPKSLTQMEIKCCEMVNFGLPLGRRRLRSANWKEGALSRLPQGLVELKITFSKDIPDTIDFDVFSHLPKLLVELELDTSSILPKDVKKLFAALPRRLSSLKYEYDKYHTKFKSENGTGEGSKSFNEQLKAAYKEYYSDPFWESKFDDTFKTDV